MQFTGPKDVTPDYNAQIQGPMAIANLVASGADNFGRNDELQVRT